MPQDALPTSDITTSGSAQATPHYDDVDDNLFAAGSDADNILSSNSSATRTLEHKLGAVTDPAVGTGHIIHWRGRLTQDAASSPDTVTITISLYEGATLRASFTPTVGDTGYGNHTYTLSAAEADAITAYSDLRIRTVMTRTATDLVRQTFRVSDEKLEVPNVSTGQPASRRYGGTSARLAVPHLGRHGQDVF